MRHLPVMAQFHQRGCGVISNSLEFVVFLPIVWGVYWLFGDRPRLQNLLVVLASYVFYGWWDWRFLSLIAFTSGWSYLVGMVELGRWGRPASKVLLVASVVVNLGILGYFKYFGFFRDQVVGLLGQVGIQANPSSLDIILPVGISFYTFQALSYTIDVYRRRVLPTRDPVAFFAFISFFPQLVAGPIERATGLLPQFLGRRHFDSSSAALGCRQMLWGFFKKMVVADNCAVLANSPLVTFGLAMGGWLIFRAPDMSTCASWFGAAFNPLSWGVIADLPREFGTAAAAVVILFAVEWFNRRESFGCARYPARRWMRWPCYYAMRWAIVFQSPGSQTFLYFQF